MFEQFVKWAGYGTVAVLLCLILINVMIIVARFSSNRDFADLVINKFSPVTRNFQIANHKKNQIRHHPA